ncbi:MAG: hypothetical protein II008_10335 [Oscillospiraceae bacterium]|nr:hypothetical protein [Oscillospiraceae bacterium]MBQ1790569.1 hypothetical protein [Oscillospiraceae bacterium]
MVNALTGSDMWVAEERVDEYLQRGHKLAVPPAPPVPDKPVRRPPKRKTAKTAE